jgi:PAS domain S-box-containing protein
MRAGDASPPVGHPLPLATTSEHVQSLLNLSPDALVVVDGAGTITMLNEQAEALFGYARQELLGQQLEVLLPERFHSTHRALRKRYARDPRTRLMGSGLQLFARHQDGREFPVDVTLRPVLLDNLLHVIASVHDLARQKQLEEELAISNSILSAITESSDSNVIIGKTLHGEILSWNPGAATLYGYTSDEAIGKSIALLVPPDRRQELSDILERLSRGEAIPRFETTRLRKDGTLVDVSLSISPVRNTEGSIIGAVSIAHDISEQKHLVAEIRAANAALQEANRARSQFLATMSHELRTPLTSIIGLSQLLLEDAPAAGWNPQQRAALERVLTNGQHLLTLISEVLDLVQIELGQVEITYSRVDVREVLSWVIEQAQSLPQAHEVVVRTEVEEGVASLETSLVKVRQILLNLVSNALKFTEQGEIVLSARQLGADHLAFAVQDTGIGIAMDKQQCIFEAFYQVDSGYTRKRGGMGLGLSLVRELTKLLGGEIELASAPGQGSTFRVILPVKAAHKHGTSPEAARKPFASWMKIV